MYITCGSIHPQVIKPSFKAIQIFYIKNLSAYCRQTLPVEKNHRELIFLFLKTAKYSKLNFRADQGS